MILVIHLIVLILVPMPIVTVLIAIVKPQGSKSRKPLARLGTVVEKLELGLELLTLHAYALRFADNGLHFVIAHLGDSQRAENLADLGDQSCFNHLNRDLVDESLEGNLRGGRND